MLLFSKIINGEISDAMFFSDFNSIPDSKEEIQW